ncbi:peptidase domain-containing ABC transporter [Roseibium aggregatum]|uniref:ATP-binding cassette domain-containing protein n=1 Tax=Roseibium aggregatum TaxID=187304 RepID=A0A939IZX1_9HYPH|nr:ABC transporter transmembrane domain-containing protein [Roseibium aggregatum]MBN9670496.1 ATP-binding cassette domain-containing protein [Roseibium aggregatum]
MASVLTNILGLAMPLAVLQVYDRVLPNASLNTLWVLIAGVVTVLIADGVIKVSRAAVVGRLGAGFNHQAHKELFRRILDAETDLFASVPVSVQAHRLRSLQSVAEHYGDQRRLLAVDLPAGTIFFVVLAYIAGPLALVPLCLLCGFLMFALKRNRLLQKVIAERSEQGDRKSDFILEVLSGAKTVKSQAMEALIMRRFERLQKQAAELNANFIRLSGQQRDIASIFGTTTTVCVVVFGAAMVIYGNFSIGGVAASTLLSGQFVQPFLRAINQLTDMQRLNNDYSQVKALFQLPVVEDNRTPVGETDSSIELVNVSVLRGEGRDRVLENVNLRIEAGEFLGVRGPEGSGKTNLMRLIAGEIQPDEGRVLIGGHDYSGPERKALRKNVAYLDSQSAIFNGSILENITMFGAVSDIARARMAAGLIGLEKEIHLLPKGYDTQIGSDLGGRVPTSTLQRICIARALAVEPGILVLNEANALLDLPAERGLISALRRLKGLLTVVIVSHRPSMLAVADRQIELRDGKIYLHGGTAHAGAPASVEVAG